LEKFSESGKMSATDIESLVPESVLDSLGVIEKAVGAGGFKALTPVFKKLKGKYTYDQLRLARLLLSS
jgi:hypothetical protein